MIFSIWKCSFLYHCISQRLFKALILCQLRIIAFETSWPLHRSKLSSSNPFLIPCFSHSACLDILEWELSSLKQSLSFTIVQISINWHDHFHSSANNPISFNFHLTLGVRSFNMTENVWKYTSAVHMEDVSRRIVL